MQLTNQVADFRKKQAMTQETLAQKVDVSRQTIIAIEKGNYTPSLVLGLKISQVFGVAIEDIFSLES